MEIFTLLFGCVIHITLILVLESIVLLGILYPILHRIVDYLINKFSSDIFIEILIKTWLNSLLKDKIPNNIPIILPSPTLKLQPLTTSTTTKEKPLLQLTEFNQQENKTNFISEKSNFENLGIINREFNPLTLEYEYSFFEPINLLLKACSIDEQKYLKIQDNMPYIIYGILLFVLIVCGVIILIIVNSNNITINYKFIIITSTIIFLLVSIYSFLVLYFILAKQPYVLNFEDNFYKAFLDTYNSV